MTKKTRARSKETSRRRESELYRIAARLFHKKGYAVTSVREICRALGIRESSLYHYIESKESLLYDICHRSMRESLEAIEPVVNSRQRPDLKLKEMIATHLAVLTQNMDGHGTMLKEFRFLRPGNQKRIIEFRDKYEALFRTVIADCNREKIFGPIDVKMAARAILGMMNWLMQWFSAEGGQKSKEIARIYSELFFEGARRRDPG